MCRVDSPGRRLCAELVTESARVRDSGLDIALFYSFRPSKLGGAKRAAREENARPPGRRPFSSGGALYAHPIYLCEKKDGSKTPSKINLPGWQTRSLVVVTEEGGEGVAKGGKIFIRGWQTRCLVVISRGVAKGGKLFFFNNKYINLFII